MVSLKTVSEIQKMQKACRIAGGALNLAGRSIKPGMTTKEIDEIITRYIVSKGAKPSFLGYGGFPASACISINDEVIHGIPGSRKVQEGDIVSIDVGAYYDGYHGDNAATFAVGEVSPEAKQLMEEQGERANDVYLRVGFKNLSHFSTAFKRQYGFPPSAIMMA